MPTAAIAQARVEAGATFLDAHHPLRESWVGSIGLERLDMSSPNDCILGQSYVKEWRLDSGGYFTPYSYGSNALGLTIEQAETLGFSSTSYDGSAGYSALNRAWRIAIRARRAKPTLQAA